jgi:transcriptional antiterminator NusG
MPSYCSDKKAKKKNGKWRIVKRKLFLGYVLIKTIMNTEINYKLKSVNGIIKLLRNESKVLTVAEKELKILIDNNIGISRLYKENDSIKIIEGCPMGLEGQIIKQNLKLTLGVRP